jgi:hypothetical protein
MQSALSKSENIMENEKVYAEAKRQVERKIGFFIHLAVFVAVNSALMLLNLLLAPRMPWAFGPLFGWGIGLLFHGLRVFLHAQGATWKQRMIDKELKQRRLAQSA